MSNDQTELGDQTFQESALAYRQEGPATHGKDSGKNLVTRGMGDATKAAPRNLALENAAKNLLEIYGGVRRIAIARAPDLCRLIEQYADETRVVFVLKNEVIIRSAEGNTYEVRSHMPESAIRAAQLHGVPMVDLRTCKINPDIAYAHLPRVGKDMREGQLVASGFGIQRARPDVIASLAQIEGATVYNIPTIPLSRGMFRDNDPREVAAIQALLDNKSIVDALNSSPANGVFRYPDGEGDLYASREKVAHIESEANAMIKAFHGMTDDSPPAERFGYQSALHMLNEFRNVVIFEAWSDIAKRDTGLEVDLGTTRDNVRGYLANVIELYADEVNNPSYAHKIFARDKLLEVAKAIDPTLVDGLDVQKKREQTIRAETELSPM